MVSKRPNRDRNMGNRKQIKLKYQIDIQSEKGEKNEKSK